MELKVDEVMEAFFQLKKQGKIRFAGASNFYAWQIYEANQSAKLQGWEGYVSIQQRYSYLEPGMDAKFGSQLLLTPEIQDFCAKANIAIMVYSPLLGGIYSTTDQLIPLQYDSAVNKLKLFHLKEVAKELGVPGNTVVL
jgi:aryl-alcohol dehydrogenase-like predicted oxidoreductase